ncbi:MAG TPA: glycine oxidase ThiO, partial [Geminicoccaceae bacterium]|nr:glycine oxidase ThiO [Geminicoccaceae bacterium]
AGMLAAGVEAEPGEERLFALNRLSQSLWPDFARELEAETGVRLGYRAEGTLVAGFTRDDVAQLRFAHDFQRGLGVELEWLSGREARAREPYLCPGTLAAVFSPHDHQVDNRRVVTALKRALLAAGGRLHEHTPVAAIDTEGGRVRGLRVGDSRHPADAVLLAAGAWSRAIAGLPDGLRPPVRPIKGQMLALQMDPAAPLLRHVVWAPKVYLVPREDGRLIVGGTVEERGFDDRMTAGGVFSLIEAAWRAVPAIEELPIAEMWVGFRPGSRDDAPILGPMPSVEGLTIATGHHRNGILLAPVTIDAVSRHVLTGEVDPAIRPFGLERFAPAAAAAAPATPKPERIPEVT